MPEQHQVLQEAYRVCGAQYEQIEALQEELAAVRRGWDGDDLRW